jgi:protein-S-isoprenylcysteine O-methyltransferase Ste14
MSLFAYGIRLSWLSVLAYWAWSARGVKRPASQQSLAVRYFAYVLPLILAAILLGPGHWFGHSWLREQLLAHTRPVYAAGLALGMAGAALSIYSRAILGRNWSASVQLKHDHELIQSGPYRFVRHPIYTGFLLLFLGSAIMIGEWRGLISVAIVLVSFLRKLRLEEAWLGRHFGPAYQEYRHRTKALIPAVL